MARSLIFVSLLLTTACASVSRAAPGRTTAPGSGPGSGGEEVMPLYSEQVLGPHQRVITTSSREAQAYFNQGMQLLYSFTPPDAARSFRQAQRRDPNCAMCYFGEAWALGPYLNGPMRPEDAPAAYEAIHKAQELAKERSNEIERALIGAMAERYQRRHDATERVRLDSVYSRAMGEVVREYPDDLEAGTLYGESLMLLLPRRGNWDLADPTVQEAHRALEGVLSRDIRHPGACHLYVHATESTTAPGKAESCANYLGNAIPGASHINHMPSHTYNRIGRWGDAARANIQAWHSDQKSEYGEGFAIYPSHNVHMLLFAASMDGQGGIAAQAARDYEKIVEGGQFYRGLVLVRFGRFDEVLEVVEVPEDPTFAGFLEFSRGYAHLRLGDADSARVYLDALQTRIRTMPETAQFRGHPGSDLLSVVGGILEGEMLVAQERLEDAIRVLEESVRVEDGIRYDEPEPLNFSARHWLGAVLLEAGRPQDAEGVYRAALEDHPNNGWCLFGLEQALRAQGKTGTADQVHAQFLRAWERADVWLRSSRF